MTTPPCVECFWSEAKVLFGRQVGVQCAYMIPYGGLPDEVENPHEDYTMCKSFMQRPPRLTMEKEVA